MCASTDLATMSCLHYGVELLWGRFGAPLLGRATQIYCVTYFYLFPHPRLQNQFIVGLILEFQELLSTTSHPWHLIFPYGQAAHVAVVILLSVSQLSDKLWLQRLVSVYTVLMFLVLISKTESYPYILVIFYTFTVWFGAVLVTNVSTTKSKLQNM